MVTIEQIEDALDTGWLWTLMANMRWLRCRRNGKTQRWVRDPARFRIPIKYGFKGCGAVDALIDVGFDEHSYYTISSTQPILGESRFVREMKGAAL